MTPFVSDDKTPFHDGVFCIHYLYLIINKF